MPLFLTREKNLYLLYIVNISSEYIYNRIIIISKDNLNYYTRRTSNIFFISKSFIFFNFIFISRI